MNNISWLWISATVFFILTSIAYLNRRKLFGKTGEFWTKRELRKLNKEYKIINDIMIRTSDGSTHQIDHIVISKYGIFVIETKQYNGYLIGNDYDKKWRFKTNRKTYYINNPVHQNYGHVQALKEILNIQEEKLIPIVCISSNAKLRINSNVVVRITKLLDKIKSYNNQIIYNEEEIYNRINNLNILDKKERRQHIKNTKQKKKIKEKESINKCPKCGGELVERNGLYGKFIGCSNYPRCRFIKR